MKDNKQPSFAALIVAKLACCGVLLLALSGVSLGARVSAVSGNGWVQFAGVSAAVFAAGWWLFQRRRGQICGGNIETEVRHDCSISRPGAAMKVE